MKLIYKGPEEFKNAWGYQTKLSACFDLITTRDFFLTENCTAAAPTGLFICQEDVGDDPYRVEYMEVLSRSGLALNSKIVVLNAPGIIDADYPNEIMVILHNFSGRDYLFLAGDRIAQGRFGKFIRDNRIPVKTTTRTGGMGSTK